jgi:hypothetical protein
MGLIISLRYRKLISYAIWVFAVVSTVLSFFLLPLWVSAIISIVNLLFGIFGAAVTYRIEYLFIHRRVNPKFDPVWIGSILFEEIDSKNNNLGFGLVYESKSAARESFATFKFYIQNRFSDSKMQIKFSIIHENNKKYTYIIYPVRKGELLSYLKTKWKEGLDFKNVLKVHEFTPYLQISVDYEENVKAAEKLLDYAPNKFIYFNTFYIIDNSPMAYSKKQIKLYNNSFFERQNLNPDMIEYYCRWYDAKKLFPEKYEKGKLLEKINKNKTF